DPPAAPWPEHPAQRSLPEPVLSHPILHRRMPRPRRPRALPPRDRCVLPARPPHARDRPPPGGHAPPTRSCAERFLDPGPDAALPGWIALDLGQLLEEGLLL